GNERLGLRGAGIGRALGAEALDGPGPEPPGAAEPDPLERRGGRARRQREDIAPVRPAPATDQADAVLGLFEQIGRHRYGFGHHVLPGSLERVAVYARVFMIIIISNFSARASLIFAAGRSGPREFRLERAAQQL